MADSIAGRTHESGDAQRKECRVQLRTKRVPTACMLGASPSALPALRPRTAPTVYALAAAPAYRAHFPARDVPYRAHSRRVPCHSVHFPSGNGPCRVRFTASPAKTARAVRTFRPERVPAVYTYGPLVYTVGGLPCRKVRTVGVLFAVHAFRPERVPAVYTYGREARGA